MSSADDIPGDGGLFAVAGVRPLVAAGLVARLPDGMIALAIIFAAREATDSIAQAGAVAAASAVGLACTSPLRGRLVDSRGPRVGLLALGGMNSGLLCSLAVAGSQHAGMRWLVLLGAFTGATTPPVQAVTRSVWPRLLGVSKALLKRAYSFEAVSQEVVFIGGPIVVAAMGSVADAFAALVACGLLRLAGIGGILALPVVGAWRPSGSVELVSLGVLRVPGMRVLVLATVPYGMMFGALDVGVTAFADRLGAVSTAGVLLALTGLGSMIGGIAYARVTWNRAEHVQVIALAVVLAACVTPLASAGTTLGAALLLLLAGAAVAPYTAAVFSLLDDLVDAVNMAEAMTWLVSAQLAGVAIGSYAAGQAAEVAIALGLLIPSVGAWLQALVLFLGLRRTPVARP